VASVYLETTILSYLTSRPSRDVLVAGLQAATRDWWDSHAGQHDLVISESVLVEIGRGDPDAAQRRLEAAASLRVLPLSEEVRQLTAVYGDELRLPARALEDAAHIAFAVAYCVDYLLTWNCRHIADGATISKLSAVNARLGRFTPAIVTPLAFIEYDGSEGNRDA
jgi:predicted nucleic acid-binding protein